MQVLNQDIKEHTFKPVYLLFGEEVFLKNTYKKRLREAIIGEDTMNFARFEGKGLDVDELIRLADTMPFFAERRLILVEDSGFFKNASEALVKYLPDMPDTTCLVFAESEVDKRSSSTRRLRAWAMPLRWGDRTPHSLEGGLGESWQRKEGRSLTGPWSYFSAW